MRPGGPLCLNENTDLDEDAQGVREILLTYLQEKRGYSENCAEALFGILGEHI